MSPGVPPRPAGMDWRQFAIWCSERLTRYENKPEPVVKTGGALRKRWRKFEAEIRKRDRRIAALEEVVLVWRNLIRLRGGEI